MDATPANEWLKDAFFKGTFPLVLANITQNVSYQFLSNKDGL